MNVLVVAPHPDDESIGCGGSLCLHANAGDRVHCVFLSSGELALRHLPPDRARSLRESEAERAACVLGVASWEFLRLPDWSVGAHASEIADVLRARLAALAPAIVYLPHPAEWHPDHQACLPPLRQALERADIARPVLRLYEIWTPLQDYTHAEDITSVMRRKVRAVRSHASQLERYRYDAAIRGLNRYRAVMARKGRFAEAFRHVDPARPAPPEGAAAPGRTQGV